MKKKRQKRAAREWAEFQLQHELSDEDLTLARQTGFPITRLQSLLAEREHDTDLTVGQKIQAIHRMHQEQVAARHAAIEAGEIPPKPKKPKMKPHRHDPMWAKAKEVCRLNMDDIRKAKALGMSPKSLIRNVPSPKQRWKAPVKVWIRDLYEKRFPSQHDHPPKKDRN